MYTCFQDLVLSLKTPKMVSTRLHEEQVDRWKGGHHGGGDAVEEVGLQGGISNILFLIPFDLTYYKFGIKY